MSQQTPTEVESRSDVYLPATPSSSVLLRIEAALRKAIGGHGIGPIPSTYNE